MSVFADLVSSLQDRFFDDPSVIGVPARYAVMSDSAHPGGAGLPDENQGPRILAATTVTTVFALLTVMARMYVRLFIIRNVGLDDYTMILTMMLSLAGWAIIIPEVIYGAGRHTAYVKDTATTAMHLNFATQGIYMWAIGLVKISIGLFLLRFAPRKGYKIFIWVIIVLMLLYTTICFLTLIFQCKDIRSIWDMSVKSKCFTPTQLLELSYTNTALNILTDLIFAILPAFMLRHLQVNRRVKASLVCILGLGIFACAAAFVKLSVLPNYGRTGDFLWDYSTLTIWVVYRRIQHGYHRWQSPNLKTPLQASPRQLWLPLQTRPYNTYGSKQYRLRSLSRSRQGQSQTLHSAPQSRIEVEADQKLPSSRHFATTTTTTTTTYPGNDGSNSSEEYILSPTGPEGIMCTTEVMVSHAAEARNPARGKKSAHFGGDDVV
ncbi:integral membrane family protein [Aspergillus nomiae NRRL 13137]|uniref:Integral membrane family protein n=1 Tax=Aspergillus nomiae NRRL (strain ATCC 15546 / NRRL 13137 / CBS 260.88 / M93) TaxID=1509407 RepID=A0A0L1IW05_ASPN3|nr:integral membrane family protein [Aspergillus nomiae NRRL 13137]KNG83679.1 integral membrane family protein [Aspergillus nomiae NRRL 13137]